MADLGENLRAHLIASTGVAAQFASISAVGIVQQNKIDESAGFPRIYFRRSAQVEELDLAANGGLTESTWDLEILSDDIDEAVEIAAAVKSALHGHRGRFGSTSSTASIKGCFVDDQDDEYEPKGLGTDEGAYVAALALIIYST